jgi:acyl transferase domain-containing protein
MTTAVAPTPGPPRAELLLAIVGAAGHLAGRVWNGRALASAWDAQQGTPRAASPTVSPVDLLAAVSEACLEDAGHGGSAWNGWRVGVYLGLGTASPANGPEPDPRPVASWSGLAGAWSRLQGFDGPSVQLDASGGHALVAMSLAVQALQAGVCDAAFVAGLDASEAELCMLLLKPLEVARRDGDHVHAVVQAVTSGSAHTSDGTQGLAGLFRQALALKAGASSVVCESPGSAWVLHAPTAASPAATDALHPMVVCLSARSDAALRQDACRLLDAVKADPTCVLADLAYTLQVGRTPMPVRAAFVARDMTDLQTHLGALAYGGAEVAGCHRGVVGQAAVACPLGDDDLQMLVALWIGEGRLDKLAQTWVRGLAIDAPLGHYGTPRRRMSLPSRILSPMDASSPRPVARQADGTRFDIAVVGMSARLPGAPDVEALWQRLTNGDNCIQEVPPERWDWRAFHDDEKGREGRICTRWGGFIDDIDAFDALFFNISPREAEGMDPQERLFLQEAHACLWDAGYAPADVCPSKKVGVFVGVMNSAYSLVAEHWSIANRVSSVFGFHGPSLAVDTACSSSLTALHLACESLYRGDCDAAVVGGVSLLVDPAQVMRASAKTMLSSGPNCSSFGAGADGFVDSEGVAALLLKPLERAVADGDHVHGVIKACAVNHGGRTIGYAVPSPKAQAEVIATALQRAGVHPRAVSYVEAHGTGTLRGDPIEMAGLTRTFLSATLEKGFCSLGSIKSNIGHCESAAGIAGLIKVLLQMKHQTLVKSLHSTELNPSIDFANSPFFVQQEMAPWHRPVLNLDGVERAYPRVAGVSSFGSGGANAHVVVEEYVPQAPPAAPPVREKQAVLVVLSARDEDRLRVQVQRLLKTIRNRPLEDDALHDLACTLQVGREPLAVRLACVTGSMVELAAQLEGHLAGRSDVDGLYTGAPDPGKALALFANDRDLQDALRVWVQRGKLRKLAALWVRGPKVDWQRLQANGTFNRLSLPTYPFAGERHWKRAHAGPTPMPGLRSEKAKVASELATTPVADSRETPATRVQAFILRTLSEALNLAPEHINPDCPMLDYGVDSVVSMKLVRKIEGRFEVSLAGRDLFEHSTVQALAQRVASQLPTAARTVEVEALEQFKSGQLNMDELHGVLRREGVL